MLGVPTAGVRLGETIGELMKNFVFSLVLFYCSCVLAGDAEDMRAILQANFDACNIEDVNALMDTCSVDMPDRPGFRRESEKLFREKDIYYRLVGFKVTEISGDYATASVIQLSHTNNRDSNDEREAFFRNGTTLLTKDECVKYNVAFKKDNGKWKCLATISEPIPCELESE